MDTRLIEARKRYLAIYEGLYLLLKSGMEPQEFLPIMNNLSKVKQEIRILELAERMR